MRRLILCWLVVFVLTPILWTPAALADGASPQKPTPPPTPAPAKPTVPPTPSSPRPIPPEKPEPEATLVLMATPAVLPATGGPAHDEITGGLALPGMIVILALLGIAARRRLAS